MSSWAHRAPRVEVSIDCNSSTHTIVLYRGSLVLCDHDLAGERALEALGGDEPGCLGVLRAWRESTLDTVTTPESVRARMRSHGRVPAWVVVSMVAHGRLPRDRPGGRGPRLPARPRGIGPLPRRALARRPAGDERGGDPKRSGALT